MTHCSLKGPICLYNKLSHSWSFCLKNTYFLFQGKYKEQVHGAVMGSPISLLIANLFREEFKIKALSSAPHPPHLWLMYVDDIFVIQESKYSQKIITTHQLTGPTYAIHCRGNKPKGRPTFPGQLGYSWHYERSHHHCLQKVNIH